MKILLIVLSLLLFISCGTIDTITIANQQLYYDEEAIIAYEFYNELYKNDVINTKPIIFKKEYQR
jgi:uncharacterized protein YceK